MFQEAQRFKTAMRKLDLETQCGAIALRLGPTMTSNMGGKPVTVGIDWLARSTSPQQTERTVKAVRRFMEYVGQK